jgi:dUTP pyrophosphatase
MKVKVLKNGFENNIKLPAKAGDVGFDLVAKSATVVGNHGNTEVKYDLNEIIMGVFFARLDYIEYDTGVALAPDQNLFSLGFPRSGLSKYSLLQCNSVGVIDTGYRGTIKVRFKYIYQNEDYVPGYGFQFNPKNVMKVGDRVDQLVFTNVVVPELEYVDVLEETARGAGGFGSTGN